MPDMHCYAAAMLTACASAVYMLHHLNTTRFTGMAQDHHSNAVMNAVMHLLGCFMDIMSSGISRTHPLFTHYEGLLLAAATETLRATEARQHAASCVAVSVSPVPVVDCEVNWQWVEIDSPHFVGSCRTKT